SSPVSPRVSLSGRLARLRLEVLEERWVPTVHLGNNFAGMSFLDTSAAATPPDTIIAVGPNVIVEAVNTAIQITDKSGNVLMPPEAFSPFLAPVFTPGDGFSDPYVLYDDSAQRFYVGGIELRYTPAGAQFALFDFAASNTPDPTQASDWTVFRAVSSVSKRG